MSDNLWLLGQQREQLASQITALHDSCGAASKRLAEFAFDIYKKERVSLTKLARCAGMDPTTFRAIMWKYIGKEHLRAVRRARRKPLPTEVT
jgi:hypothetical protein